MEFTINTGVVLLANPSINLKKTIYAKIQVYQDVNLLYIIEVIL